MTEQSAHWALPLLQAGQAQKELFHNEALTAIDMIAQAAAVSAGLDVPPADPTPGECWIVGAAPEGDWEGRAGALAGWTDAGWRFVLPVEGMTVWIADSRLSARYRDGAWIIGEVTANRLVVGGEQVVGARMAGIAVPEGGSVIDVEARAAIAAMLGMVRAHGLIES